MSKVNGIVIHTSAHPTWGVGDIRRFHTMERGFDDIGYHYVIETDGNLKNGRDVKFTGAHVLGFNSSIGICICGTGLESASKAQRLKLKELLKKLFSKYNFNLKDTHPHFIFESAKKQKKTCPFSTSKSLKYFYEFMERLMNEN